jgi:uncharacterized protein YciI
MIDQNGPTYFVVFQSPGPKWVAGTAYNEQPEFGHHVQYMEECHAKGKIVLSGPFMEGVGVMASSGMTVFKAADLEEATALGTEDPTVKSGMLKVEIRPWWIPFHD